MNENKTKIKFHIMAVVLIIVFCFAISPISLQNDTFYTIKIGEYIMENGVTDVDPFSWHEGLKYTYPHWGYDVIVYKIYNLGGHIGIYISTIAFASLLGIAMYLINVSLTKNRVTSFVLTIGAIYMMSNYIAARAQLLTYILFILTIFGIEKFLATKQKRYAIMLFVIPILIANLHAAVFAFYFILYLPYIGEYVAHYMGHSNIIGCRLKIKKLNKRIKATTDNEEIRALSSKLVEMEARLLVLIERREKYDKTAYKIITQKNENTKWLIVIMIIALFTGFLTPIGLEPYVHLYNLMSGISTQNISEHQPLMLVQSVNLICVFILFLAILMFTDTKIRLCDLFMLGGMLVLTFYSRRQESLFIITCIFVLNKLICSMFNKYDPEGCDKLESRMTKIIGQITIIALILTISVRAYKPKMDNEYVDSEAYPVAAADYIMENVDIENMRLYNEYNYGSYLIYRGIPVFIDSRADLYTEEFNPEFTIFQDFLDLSSLGVTNIKKALDNYDFTHLMMYSNAKLRIYLNENEDKYKQVYDDEKFCIYEKISDTV